MTPYLWVTDTRLPESPYETAFLHYSEIRFEDRYIQDELPSRDLILEFELVREDKGFVAKGVEVTYSYSVPRRSAYPREPYPARKIDTGSRPAAGEFDDWPEEMDEIITSNGGSDPRGI